MDNEQRRLLGKSEHVLDDRGRLAIPKRYRDLLGSQVVLTVGPENSIEVYTQEGFGKLAELIFGPDPAPNQRTRDLRRALYARSEEVELDGQGRILIPSWMREEAGIESAVAVIGSGDYLEIWDREQWRLRDQRIREEYAILLETVERRHA